METITTVLLNYQLFPALSVLWRIASPFIAQVLPLNKEVVHVYPGSEVKYNPETQYPVFDFIGLVEEHGYIAEAHKVTTEDGYILKMHRISGGPGNPKAAGKPVVYFQHGIGMISDSWVIMGPKRDLAFLLVDAGYDVWIANTRGNVYSREHISINPDSESYWNFSWHEMGIYDTPAFIDKILNETGVEKLTYYCHSMGTTISYVLLSMRPEYNDKINMVYSITPAAYWGDSLRRIPSTLSRTSVFLKGILDYYNWYEVFPQSALAIDIGKRFCSVNNTILQPLCIKLFDSTIGLTDSRVDKVIFQKFIAIFPTGISRLTLYHYLQNIQNKTFQTYDYGNANMNLEKYGQKDAPYYNLTKITAPVTIWYAENDDWINPTDVLRLASALPNVTIKTVNLDWFNHGDYIWTEHAKDIFYDKLPFFHKN